MGVLVGLDSLFGVILLAVFAMHIVLSGLEFLLARYNKVVGINHGER